MYTCNFVVDAPNPKMAREIGRLAEKWRSRIALEWLGRELGGWRYHCPIFVTITKSLAFCFTYHDRGNVSGISLRGGWREICDSILSHEIAHAVLATAFHSKLPRWADEGIALSYETDPVSRLEFRWGRRSLRRLFGMKNYPWDWQPYYAQSYSVTSYLIEAYGRKQLLKFALAGSGGWPSACRRIFGKNLDTIERDWRDWHGAWRAVIAA